jgi:hypothetical protein
MEMNTVLHIICDEKGEPIFATQNKEDAHQWLMNNLHTTFVLKTIPVVSLVKPVSFVPPEEEKESAAQCSCSFIGWDDQPCLVHGTDAEWEHFDRECIAGLHK